MLTPTPDIDAVAARLALALKRLQARLREEAQANAGLSLSQLAILQRLRRDGPATAAVLATAEHVSQQAIAQSIALLKSAGFVQTAPDPTDGRKTCISITDAASRLHASIIASRTAWLAHAIDTTIDAEERAALATTVDLLERLAEAD